MRTDSDIKRDVEEEIKYDADVLSSDIGVSVKSGVVALTGFVGSYSQKLQAEADAKRVSGVMGVANDIQVRIPSVDARPDPEIARDVVEQLKGELPFSYEQIKSVVKNGWVTLEGNLAMELSAHEGRERHAACQGCDRSQQPNQTGPASESDRGQGENRERIEAQRSNRRESHQSRSQRR